MPAADLAAGATGRNLMSRHKEPQTQCSAASGATIAHSSVQEGALQPVIGLLSSRCTESQREAALLLGQFATATVTGNEDYKVPSSQIDAASLIAPITPRS